MEVHYPTLDAPATPEYVLAVMRECCDDDHPDDADRWSLDASIADWRCTVEDAYSDDFEVVLERLWEIHLSPQQWRSVLEPADQKSARDVCEWIAGQVRRPCIRPARLLGNECLSAGAFLTIRSLLNDAGTPAATIAPSTPLAPFTRRYGHVFFVVIPRLAPGAMPRAHIVAGPLAGGWFGCACVGVVAAFLAGLTGSIWLQAAAVLAIMIAGLMCFLGEWLGPREVTFGTLRTFRDLAKLIADDAQRDGNSSRATT